MNSPKIYIASSTFAKNDLTPLKTLQKTGWQIFHHSCSPPLLPEEIAEWAKDADGLLISTQNLHNVIDRFKHLKFISRTGIGLDSVPLRRCRELGICVHYTPDAVTDAVSEIVLGVMICQARRLLEADSAIRKNRWERKIGRSLSDSTIGIVGFGRIGKSLVRQLSALRTKRILVCDLRNINAELEELRLITGANLENSTLQEIIKNSHFISLHVPKTKKTINMISYPEMAQMKQDAFLINFSRGGIINEQHLHKILTERKIQGAALDVFEEEPYYGPLIKLPNIILSAHMGSCSTDARLKMDTQAVEAIIHFFTGKALKNEVNLELEESYSDL